MKTSTFLHSGWKLKWCDHSAGRRLGFVDAATDSGWMDATVPGDIHIDCQNHGIIADPFFGANIDHLIWMEDKEWWYRLDFPAPDRHRDQRIFLLFEGLDTFATVFLNGREIAKHENMFTPLRLDVTDELQTGVNRLAICFSSPRFSVRMLPSEKVVGEPPLHRLFVRKAQSCFGWDIAPRLLTCGIWMPVSLQVVDRLEIAGCSWHTLAADERTASVEVAMDILKHGSLVEQPLLRLHCDGQSIEVPFAVDSPCTTVVQTLTIPSPQLWWPHNHGTPALISYSLELIAGGKKLDKHNGRFGIRTVQLEQEPLPHGETGFCFRVNGKRIFLKGMNWTPADAITARIDRDRYATLLAMAKEANINALRVWGGGIYEKDDFYDLCDELGILVWQDFMFSCGCYPQDESFLRQVQEEAEHVVSRLRSHPCLLVWCGDNECDQLAAGYGVPDYPANRLSKEILPGVVHRLCPQIPYVPSSPHSPHLADQNSDREGDVHLWEHGESFEGDFYLKRRPKMVTEMGHIALPDLETIRSFIPPEERWPIFNEVWRLHSADPLRLFWNRRLDSLFTSIRAKGWDEPTDLDDLIRKTQELQSQATATWIRHFANLSDCWGLFLWNLADSWPQVSDAYIGYPLQPKPAWRTVGEEYGKIKR